MGQIDVKKLKASLSLLDIEHVMNQLGIPMYSKGNREWIFYPGTKYKDPYAGKPKLYFYTDSKIFISYTESCSMDIIGVVQKRLALLNESCSFLDAVNYILETTGKEVANLHELTKSSFYDWESDLGKFSKFGGRGSGLKCYDASVLNHLSQLYPLRWIDEGISWDSMKKYRIGFYDRMNQTTIPVFGNGGGLLGIRCRNWTEDMLAQAKYIPLTLLDGTTYKFPTHSVLYGLNYNWPTIERKKEVWIAEGEKSVLKLDTWYGTESCAVAMFGNNLGLQRRQQLLSLGVNKVFYIPDHDFVGLGDKEFNLWTTKLNKFCELWHGFATVNVLLDTKGCLGAKDNATDYNKEIFTELLENSVQM